MKKIKTANQSTYITDEGDFYHIYGKTFGANQKETALLCLAISAISEKPVRLFQILDNGSEKLSAQDIKALKDFAEIYGTQKIDILDENYNFDSDESDKIQDNLRSPRFVFNLLEKFGKKYCLLCDCGIESIVQAAHIFPVSEIRKATNLTDEQKREMATDGENGFWLCENHHKLFDRNLVLLEGGNFSINADLSAENQKFIQKITTKPQIDKKFLTKSAETYLKMRCNAKNS